MSPPFARLLPFLLRYKRAFLLGLACVVITTAIQLLSPWVLKNAIDDLNAGVTRGKLAMYAALLLTIALVGGAFRFLMRRILIGASRDIEYDMRNAFFARLQQMPLAYYQARRTGDLMSRATNDLNAVRTMIGPAVMYTANTMIVFVVAIILMASIDARLTLIALLPLPLVSVSVKYFGSAIHTRFEAIQAQLADLSAVVQEALSGVRVVRAYNQEPHELARFRAANDEYVRRNRVLIRLQGMFYPSMTLFLGFGSLLVLWMGSREVIRGRISVGEFVAFNAYLVMLSWPMIAFGWVTNILQRGMASWKRMLDVLDAQPEIDDRAVSDAGRAAVIRGAIEIRDLTFTYPAATTPALDRVSLRIEAGQTAAFIGATGSGKSTLINLLPRLHEPPSGTIFLDGIDVREIPLATLRGAIGFVPQEPFLFSDTIAENIAFGVAPAGPSAAADALDARHPRCRGHRPARQGRRDVSQRLRHARRRARHHVVGRAEAANGDCPGADGGSAAAHSRRCAVGRGYVYRGRNPGAAPRRDASADVAHRVAPRVDGPRCRPDLRARSRAHRRARPSRRPGRARRRVRHAASPAAARGGARGELIAESVKLSTDTVASAFRRKIRLHAEGTAADDASFRLTAEATR